MVPDPTEINKYRTFFARHFKLTGIAKNTLYSRMYTWKMLEKEFGTTKEIKYAIAFEIDKIIALFESKYTNTNTLGTHLSFVYVLNKIMNKSIDNTKKMCEKLTEIRKKRDDLQKEKNYETDIAFEKYLKDKYGNESSIDNIKGLLKENFDERNTWLYEHTNLDIEDFIEKFGKGFKIEYNNVKSDHTQIKKLNEMVHCIEIIAFIYIEVCSGFVGRSEGKTIKWVKNTKKDMKSNYISLKDMKIYFRTYKTQKKYGDYSIPIDDFLLTLLRFIRVFNTSSYVFVTTGGKIISNNAIGKRMRRMIKCDPDIYIIPTTLRRIAINSYTYVDMNKLTFNSESTRKSHYLYKEK